MTIIHTKGNVVLELWSEWQEHATPRHISVNDIQYVYDEVRKASNMTVNPLGNTPGSAVVIALLP